VFIETQLDQPQGICDVSYRIGDQPPRVSVRAIPIRSDYILVQEGSVDSSNPNNPAKCFAFIGGGYEPGDTFESRIKREFEEETNAKVMDCSYLFVVENRRIVNGTLRQSIDHFFEVSLDRQDIESRELHISQHWLPISTLMDFDLRPHTIRDLIAKGEFTTVRHVVIPFED